MIDNNIRTDYNKLRHLIRLDKKMGMNASIIQDIVTNGETVGTIKTAFPPRIWQNRIILRACSIISGAYHTGY
ncbi:MAG: hypothetical protein ACLSB7_04775 [Parabacteroides distasonis]